MPFNKSGDSQHVEWYDVRLPTDPLQSEIVHDLLEEDYYSHRPFDGRSRSRMSYLQ